MSSCRTLIVVSRRVPNTFHRARLVLQDPGAAMSQALVTKLLGLIWSRAYVGTSSQGLDLVRECREEV